MEIPMQSVKSSLIASVGYDEVTQELHVRFKRGRQRDKDFIYSGVPRSVYENMMSQKSVGAFFVQEIKYRYEWRRGG